MYDAKKFNRIGPRVTRPTWEWRTRSWASLEGWGSSSAPVRWRCSPRSSTPGRIRARPKRWRKRWLISWSVMAKRLIKLVPAGGLLVLGSYYVDKALRGYMTKYDSPVHWRTLVEGDEQQDRFYQFLSCTVNEYNCFLCWLCVHQF